MSESQESKSTVVEMMTTPFRMWREMYAEQMTQLESMQEQVEGMQERAMSEARHTIDEMSKLAQASVDYNQRLGEAWRESSREAWTSMESWLRPS